ncbi:hypothetical protein CLV57_2373 [Mucilaginibacter auburnensis]|uniref:Uncharacterized protein n=1 Tax=Mucilaginibacter auburnensis TaxID=1457233 RepID=A0A2H9VLM7_9SPHI|nr:hypothetical protein CLV57_2373 [Mucilaginibacter auburnensis]
MIDIKANDFASPHFEIYTNLKKQKQFKTNQYVLVVN